MVIFLSVVNGKTVEDFESHVCVGEEAMIEFSDSAFVEKKDMVSDQPVKRKASQYVFEKGHGVWVYKPKQEFVLQILQYNKKAKIKIRYLFPWAGSVTGADIDFEDENLAFYYEALKGSEVRIYPMIDGLDNEFQRATPEEQDALAKKIAERYNADVRIAGIHFDIEPFNAKQFSFYKALQKYLEKPLSIAFGSWNQEVLSVCDLPVLMGYDVAKTPEKFKESVSALYQSFASDCRTVGSSYLIGLPFIATHNEWEYAIKVSDNSRENSGFFMEDFLNPAFQVVEGFKQDSFFTGLSIWAFLDTPVGYNELYQWYPFEISKKGWKRLEKFNWE